VKNGSSSWINRINARKIFKILGKILLIDEHMVKDSHILKLNILGCDKTLACDDLTERARGECVDGV
jgi:hypothetical protein